MGGVRLYTRVGWLIIGLICSHLVGSIPTEFLELALSLLCEQYNLDQTTDFISGTLD